MLRYFIFQSCPLPAATLWHTTPKVELQLTLGCWRALKGLVRTIKCGKFARCLTGSEVNGFEYVFVQPLGILAFERIPHLEE